jgi:hypothetical protein
MNLLNTQGTAWLSLNPEDYGNYGLPSTGKQLHL